MYQEVKMMKFRRTRPRRNEKEVNGGRQILEPMGKEI